MGEFARWVGRFRRKALRNGISSFTFDSSFRNVHFNKDVIAKDQDQPETGQPIWEYLDRAVSEARVQNGRDKVLENLKSWEKLENTFGVEREIVAAIWGLESAYGKTRGDYSVIEALATLAFDGRRKSLFEDQLIAALRIIQFGDIQPTKMRGSWAGAMGHTQFMPASYLENAIAYNGGGRSNIWGENPWDALASAAAYLANSGWLRGQPWGVEVFFEKGDEFDYGLCGLSVTKEVNEWADLNVLPVLPIGFPKQGPASILLSAGANGPAFMVFENFLTLLRYNGAISYGLAAGHLADRIRGGANIITEWPRNDRQLSREERREIQERLTRAGFNTYGVDGIFGSNTYAALRDWQIADGTIADGYPSYKVLEKLRR